MITMATPKVPGWGLLRPQEARASPKGELEFLICPDDHDAPFWANLNEVHRHQGRIIYEETNHDNKSDGNSPSPAVD